MNRKLKLWELERPSVEVFQQMEKFPIVLVLDGIRSLNNVGAFFRTADAFNVNKIFLCGITPVPPHREIQKTALGATESVTWEYAEDILELVAELKDQGYTVCAVEQTEKPLFLHNLVVEDDRKYAVILGNEVDGVQQNVINLADLVLEVPQFGTKHSLNVSVCAGVVLWEFVRAWAK